jgi:hypothetical protein
VELMLQNFDYTWEPSWSVCWDCGCCFPSQLAWSIVENFLMHVIVSCQVVPVIFHSFQRRPASINDQYAGLLLMHYLLAFVRWKYYPAKIKVDLSSMSLTNMNNYWTNKLRLFSTSTIFFCVEVIIVPL